jgi:hypothetical protein
VLRQVERLPGPHKIKAERRPTARRHTEFARQFERLTAQTRLDLQRRTRTTLLVSPTTTRQVLADEPDRVRRRLCLVGFG